MCNVLLLVSNIIIINSGSKYTEGFINLNNGLKQFVMPVKVLNIYSVLVDFRIISAAILHIYKYFNNDVFI